MTEMLALSERDVDEALRAGDLRGALEEAFVAISRRAIDVPDRISAATPEGMLLAMPGFVRDVGLATKLVTLFPDNPASGRPSHQGVLLVFDPATGTPLAVMGAERLTQARTSTSAAIAADLLARSDSSVLAIIGAGTQGAGHLEAFSSIRDWDEIRIWNRTRERAEALAAGHHRAIVSADVASALDGSDVVALCTHTDRPLFDLGDVAPGAHVSSVGIGRELPDGLVGGARIVVEWSGVASAAPPAGALDLEGVAGGDVVEIGEILAGTAPGRTSDDELTVYKSVGHSAEDCAAGRVVIDVARSHGIGSTIEL